MDEAGYADAVERERPRLLATAYLLTGDTRQAERAVDRALAETYQVWNAEPRPNGLLLAAVVRSATGSVDLPWERHVRFELVDRAVTPEAAEPVVSDLVRLPADQRTAIVLERVALAPAVQIADLLSRPVDEVLVLARQARAALVAARPERSDDSALARELLEAVPPALRVPADPRLDAAHGRVLAARARRRRIAVAAAAAVVLVAAVTGALSLGPRTPGAQPVSARSPVVAGTPTPGPPAPGPYPSGCDLDEPPCRASTLFAWRAEMAAIARPYVDPAGRYFSGFSFAYDAAYESPRFFDSGEGALAFDLFRVQAGATEVHVQIATSRRTALRCGASTGQSCTALRFMDGNRYLLSESTMATRGIEAQYAPDGQEVITVVARTRGAGPALDVQRGDLIKLVSDPRLRLPRR